MRSDLNDEHPLIGAFRAFIDDSGFPCVGAKSALARSQIEMIVARDIRSNWDDLAIVPKLFSFAKRYTDDPSLFRSFAVIFEGPDELSEVAFEHHLWERLQSFSDKDSMFGHAPDKRVAADPADHNFSMSFGGEAFFVVGLHPGASRPARRFQTPVLVFNLHDQFVRLREQGLYEKMRRTINDRDMALAGTVNPMLVQHGQGSEAKQYSGRNVTEDWQCPFEHKDFSWPESSALKPPDQE